MVGVKGFEPPAPCSQSTYATKLRYTPLDPVAVTAVGFAPDDEIYLTIPASICQHLFSIFPKKLLSLSSSLRSAPWLPCVRGAVRRRAGLKGCPMGRGQGGGQSPSPICAPEPSFRRFRCSAWLIHDFAPSPMRALVFRSAYSASRNARASAAFAASIKAHCAVSSETLMLQVRFAHPPMPHRTSSSSCAGVSLGLFGKPKRPDSSRFAVFMGATLCFFFQNAHASGSLRSPSELLSPGGRSNQLHPPKPGKPTPGGVGGGRSRPRLG